MPTFHIVRFLLYAFMIAMIYPYLPGSDSGVFQGISVFVGLIVSLGSSTVIGNIIAGLVITYMRPFKMGDRIKLNDTTGDIIEKTPLVTRIRTPKNEVVTVPNSFIMSSHTVNYSTSAREYGLIIHSEVSIGYDVPWRQVNQILIDAALNTPGVVDDPRPFVLETSLSDWYPVYQINAYIKEAHKMSQIYSDLHQTIQDKFNEAGIDIMSVNLLLENPTDPVVWRSPVITGTVKQFWKDVIWENEDYMFVDMPPGTGDVPLTVFQSLPIDGIIVVASPQELVSMIVEKAVKMANMMNVPILGLVENMSYFVCPDCGKKHNIFGESHIDEIAERYNTKVLAKLPIDSDLAKCVDDGRVELFEGNYLDDAAQEIEKALA